MTEISQLKISSDMPDIKRKPNSIIQKRKNAINYRKSDTDKSCKHCIHTTYTREESYIHPASGKIVTYTDHYKCRKCPFIGFSRGQATDIKKGFICDKFEEEK